VIGRAFIETQSQVHSLFHISFHFYSDSLLHIRQGDCRNSFAGSTEKRTE